MNILIYLQYVLFIIIILIVQNSIYEESKHVEEDKTDEDCKNDGAQYLFATSIQQHEATKEVCYTLKYKIFRIYLY